MRPPTLGRSLTTWSVLASSREARIPAKVTLAALWSAMDSFKELSPGAMAVPKRTSLAGVYIKVCNFVDWITETIADNS